MGRGTGRPSRQGATATRLRPACLVRCGASAIVGTSSASRKVFGIVATLSDAMTCPGLRRSPHTRPQDFGLCHCFQSAPPNWSRARIVPNGFPQVNGRVAARTGKPIERVFGAPRVCRRSQLLGRWAMTSKTTNRLAAEGSRQLSTFSTSSQNASPRMSGRCSSGGRMRAVPAPVLRIPARPGRAMAMWPRTPPRQPSAIIVAPPHIAARLHAFRSSGREQAASRGSPA